MGEGAKEDEEGEAAEGGEGDEAAEKGAADGEADPVAQETTDNDAGEQKTPAAETDGEAPKEVEKLPAEAPVTNGDNGCSNGTGEENAEHNHQEDEKKTADSPVKKSKEAAKEETNAKIINATAVNSGELEHAERDADETQNNSSSCKEGDTNNRQQPQAAALTNGTSKQTKSSGQEPELALAVSREEEDQGEGGEAESPKNGGVHDGADSGDQGERQGEEDEEEMRKRDLREAAVAIVENAMSAAADQLERELSVDNGLNGCYDGNINHT